MSEQFPRELWDNPAFHKGREWGRMEREAAIIAMLELRVKEHIELSYYNSVDYVIEIIALIKGENK